ncbi:MAG: polysaccharide lyase family 1 protein [Pseudomonadota bacterium]
MNSSFVAAAASSSTAYGLLTLAALFAGSSTASAVTLGDLVAAKRDSQAAISESLHLSRALDGAADTVVSATEYEDLTTPSRVGADFNIDGTDKTVGSVWAPDRKAIHSTLGPAFTVTFGDDTFGKAYSDAARLASASGEASVVDQNGAESDASKSETASDTKPSKNTITDTDYEALVNNAVGFGANASGGRGGQICRVTSLDDTGDGTLRDCATRGGTWVVFDVSGEIVLETLIEIASNSTIDGRGADITITEHGLSTSVTENIIIHNVKISDVEGDGITVFKAKNIWISHVTVGDATDGAIDITDQSQNVTVSWTHLKDQNKTMLIGNNNSKDDDERITVTLHHNWYEGTIRRNPTVRFGKVHMYNNVLTDWGDKLGDGDGVNSVYRAQILLERNVFEAGANKLAVRTSIPGWVEVPGYINARGNSPINSARVGSSQPDKVFEASDYYEYQLDAPNSAFAETVKTYAGWQPASFFESSVFAAEAGAPD